MSIKSNLKINKLIFNHLTQGIKLAVNSENENLWKS